MGRLTAQISLFMENFSGEMSNAQENQSNNDHHKDFGVSDLPVCSDLGIHYDPKAKEVNTAL